MARFEIADADMAGLSTQALSADVFLRLGIDHSIGRGVPADMIAAHKWLNLAAREGNSDAIRLRREISQEMSAADIAEAQRQAREWLCRH